MSNMLVSAKHYASRDIDRVAGEARLRYITDVPGQQAVYLVKLSEAQAYAAAYAIDPESVPGPHLAAEASGTSQTAIAVAEAVIALAALWNDQLSPAIEGLRLGGKATVSAAADIAAVEAARDAAMAALRQV